ncbi:phosphoribosylglycinamide formyltransferase-1 [Thermonema lapsum]|uniref:Phosphoribosylglycinamide formyltransferase n=1 Tax=Thermonema lapsum TaxID=28195 RepID=A0A846MNR7_9BACT|nr:phosphoribosylglycinamide formyltransferase [Thermonema lapsum]NIK73186.1 phosphoribosylglycinamide formyltransferase-1 [Thermonema lapsum]
MTHRIAVFASGSGSNAEQLIRYFKEQAPDVGEVALIVCNKPDAYVLERAKKWNVPFLLIDRELLYERTEELIAMLKQHDIGFIVLAGFLWLIPPRLIEAYPQRIVNIHPALLPHYGGKGMYGMHVHRAVVANKEKESGITIHYVNEHYDAGQHIFQARLPVKEGTTPEQLAEQIHALEHKYYPKVVEELLRALPFSSA